MSDNLKGLYLVEPHGRLIYDGRKTAIAKSKHVPLTGSWVIVSKEQGIGLAYGVAQVGEPRIVTLKTFDSDFESHRVTLKERTRWWPDAAELYLWPIRSFEVYSQPRRVNVPPGTKTIMDTLEYISDTPDDVPDIEPGQDRERPYTETGRPRESDTSGELTKSHHRLEEKTIQHRRDRCMLCTRPPEMDIIWAGGHARAWFCEDHYDSWRAQEPRDIISAEKVTTGSVDTQRSQEVNMPWTVKNPPSCAKNWTESEKKKCVTAANAVLREGGTEQDAIFACIHAAGKTKHPGGEDGESKKTRGEGQGVDGPRQGDGGPEQCICPECGELVTHKPGTPCKDTECPKCGARMEPEPEDEDESTEAKGLTSTQEAARADAVTHTLTRLHGMFTEDTDDVQLRAMAENLVSLKAVDPATGEDSPQVCVCPQCGFTIEQLPNAPCSKMGCPKCGTAMKPSEDIEPEPGEPPEPTEETKSSRIAEFLGGVISNAKSILGLDLRPRDLGVPDNLGIVGDPGALGYKTFEAQDGRTWLILSAVNAFEDREEEIFTTKSIESYVARHEGESKKGEFWYWHVPGTKFADIEWQGMSGRFLYEAGPFDDTPIGRAFEKFFKNKK